MDASAIDELLKALSKMLGRGVDEEEDEGEGEEKPKGKTITIVSVGKSKKPMLDGLKIPKAKKQEMAEDE